MINSDNLNDLYKEFYSLTKSIENLERIIKEVTNNYNPDRCDEAGIKNLKLRLTKNRKALFVINSRIEELNKKLEYYNIF